jgi:hypothetical protein
MVKMPEGWPAREATKAQASRFPFGAQSGSKSSPRLDVSRRRPFPSIPTTKISFLYPGTLRANARRRPSGDHVASRSIDGLVVTRRRPVPSAFITQMPSLRRDVKAMRDPSGDHAGQPPPSPFGSRCSVPSSRRQRASSEANAIGPFAATAGGVATSSNSAVRRIVLTSRP